MDKAQKLFELKKDLESRKDISLISSPKDVVFGDGNPDTRIMFIGEAAGYWETVERKPFVGQAGKLLVRTLMEILQLARKDVYISNIVKARPPENRDPLPEEIEAFRPYLDKEIEIIQPEFIVTLGRYSMRKFLGESVTISKVHGQPRAINWEGRSITIYPMFHPAAALRAGEMMDQFLADFTKLRNLLNNPAKLPEPEPIETKDDSEQLQLV